ncbi:hypothetical protein H9P43_000282 [Blastocladiella emersonii ATCC 22665]|nr:hypothetical protein H9P43_000282 [Blastocladiella emersonii ATCC 22665]
MNNMDSILFRASGGSVGGALVRFRTQDGVTVLAPRRIAQKSGLLKEILNGCTEDMEVPLPKVPSSRALLRMVE